uniref:Uncharacterized protein n=1 Tax=Arundo donax TaxID=35708 RepID=A0A0A9ALQ0_ARUDO
MEAILNSCTIAEWGLWKLSNCAASFLDCQGM